MCYKQKTTGQQALLYIKALMFVGMYGSRNVGIYVLADVILYVQVEFPNVLECSMYGKPTI